MEPHRNLLGVLFERCSGATRPVQIEVGPVFPSRGYKSEINIHPGTPEDPKYDDEMGWKIFFTLPSLKKDAQSDARSVEALDEFFSQTLHMAETHSARWALSLKLVASPPLPSLEMRHPLCLQLRLDLSVYLVTPNIFGLPSHEGQLRPVFDLIRIREPEEQRHASEITMHAFLSSMKPAPMLSAVQEDAAQPRELLPSLLPFQRRSVAWLLTKEGKHVNDSGAIATSSHVGDVPLFWEKIRLSDEIVWYMNALTEELQPSYPPVEEPMGGILAEEPGLGKTLESIALIILNPAIDRSPLNSHWNADQKTNVKEIKVSM